MQAFRDMSRRFTKGSAADLTTEVLQRMLSVHRYWLQLVGAPPGWLERSSYSLQSLTESEDLHHERGFRLCGWRF